MSNNQKQLEAAVQGHTPGPWGTFDNGGNSVGARAIGVYGSDSEGNALDVAYMEMENAGRDVIQANARLIAAAPDLLELAKCMKIWVRHHRHGGEVDWMGVEQQVRAAIAKATNA